MRHLWVLVLLAACSAGTDTTSPPPPPPPPPSGTPATIIISAGDAQTGEPGAVLATRPAVLVKSAAGQPVSGAVVTFTVDSGAGSLSATSATTGANGVATAGTWTLGGAEGRNVIAATVSPVPAVRFGAVARITGGTLPATTIGTGGGTFRDLDPGPLNGFELDVPPGAATSSLQLTISYASSASVQPLAGATVGGPTVTIGNPSVSYLTAPMTVHIPVVVPPGTFPAIVSYDPVSGARETLPTIGWDAHGVTAEVSSLSSTNMTLGTSSLRARLRQGNTMVLTTNLIPTATLMQNLDAVYRPNVDGWEFRPQRTVLASNNGVGMVATSLWYFLAHPGTAKLWQQFQQAAGIEYSDRIGMRWTSVVEQSLGPAVVSAHKLQALVFGSQAASDTNEFNAVRAAMLASPLGPQPQLVLLATDTTAASVYLPVIVYRAIGGSLSIYDPTIPGDLTRTLVLGANGMQPYTNALGTVFHILNAVGISQLFPIGTIGSGYPAVANGTIGNTEFAAYPAILRSKYGPIGDTLWLADTLRVWGECATCSPVQVSANAPEATGPLTLNDGWSATVNGATLDATALVFGYDRSANAAPGVTAKGFVLSRIDSLAPIGVSVPVSWLEWRKVFFIKLADTIVTSPTPTMVGVVGTFTQQTQGALPGHVKYDWDFGDGTAKVQITDNPAAPHTFAQAGVYQITGRLLDPVTQQPMVTTRLLDTVRVAQFAWRFTSAGAPVVVLPPGGIGSLKSDTLAQNLITGFLGNLSGSPANNAIFVADSAGCRGVVLEQATNGQVLDTGYVSSAAILVMSTTCYDVSLFTGSFSMGTLGAGALAGSFQPLPNLPPNVITVAGASINATMTGLTLGGSFIWRVNYSTGVATYTVTFQGTRIFPKP